MIGMVLVTYGGLAKEFVRALEHVVGPQNKICTVCIGPDDDLEVQRQEIIDCVVDTDDGDGVVTRRSKRGGRLVCDSASIGL